MKRFFALFLAMVMVFSAVPALAGRLVIEKTMTQGSAPEEGFLFNVNLTNGQNTINNFVYYGYLSADADNDTSFTEEKSLYFPVNTQLPIKAGEKLVFIAPTDRDSFSYMVSEADTNGYQLDKIMSGDYQVNNDFAQGSISSSNSSNQHWVFYNSASGLIDITNYVIGDLTSVTYDGKDHKAAVEEQLKQHMKDKGVPEGGYTVEWQKGIAPVSSLTNAGTYRAFIKGVQSAGFTGTVRQEVTFTINKASLTIKPNDHHLPVGAQKPPLTYSANGLLSREGHKLVNLTFSESINMNAAGIYSIQCSSIGVIDTNGVDVTDNYQISRIDGTMTVGVPMNRVQLRDLKAIQNKPIDEIRDELQDSVNANGFGDASVLYHDMTLEYSLDGGSTWQPYSSSTFPVGGVPVTIPYSDLALSSSAANDFFVAHMFAETDNRLGVTAGEIETPDITKASTGIGLRFKGMSPIAIAISTPFNPIDPEFAILSPTERQILTRNEGDSATLKVVTNLPGDLYVWAKWNPVLGRFERIPGAEGDTLTLTNLSAADDGSIYQCGVQYQDGVHLSPEFELNVLSSSAVPTTGDNSHLALWSSLCLMGFAGMMILRRRKHA